ncbi:hypothetical protein GAMM_160054 [Gammaproteobacteria bacterium]
MGKTRLQVRAQAMMDKLVQNVSLHYPNDATRQLAIFSMFLKEAAMLEHKLGRKMPLGGSNHATRREVQNLKKEIEEAIKTLGKNHGKISLISMLKRVGLFKFNAESISPALISGIKRVLKEIKRKVSDDDYHKLQTQLEDEKEAKKLMEELIRMDEDHYKQGKRIREELEGYFAGVYKASEADRLQASIDFLQKQLAAIDFQISELDNKIQEIDNYLKKSAEKLQGIEKQSKQYVERIAELDKQNKEGADRIATLDQKAQKNDNRLEEKLLAHGRARKHPFSELSIKGLLATCKRKHIKHATLLEALATGTLGKLLKEDQVQIPIEVTGAKATTVEQQRVTSELKAEPLDATDIVAFLVQDKDCGQCLNEAVDVHEQLQNETARKEDRCKEIDGHCGIINDLNKDKANIATGVEKVTVQKKEHEDSKKVLVKSREDMIIALKGKQTVVHDNRILLNKH